ncbi:uncharacterized protein LOC26529991 [Drosophila willistoni]|uniref:uncharacterized protein LOC26529991 n=1 Tax=Drosophila willistoni TaxID=7260 RepID=UPI001F0758B8|nr:uncharacterized protein LOC26529991 [Drosophila willistoni]
MAKLLNEVFCMSLHTAGFVIGVLGCIGSVLMMFIIGVALFGADELARSFAKDEMDKFEPVDESMQQREEHYHTIIVIVFSFFLISVIWGLISNILLILGTKKNRASYILPWLITSAIAMFLTFIYKVFLFIRLAGSNEMHYALVGYTITLILNIYIFRGIFSLYKHIQEIQKQEQPLNLQIDNEAAHPTDTYPIYSKL